VIWKKKVGQAGGDVGKILPSGAVGAGEYLVNSPDAKHKRGDGRGTTCSLPMKAETANRMRKFGK
jgi:hypothetical protein